MHYDADVQVPADAKAVIVSPSIVGDRFVQLTPAYTGGPVLASGTTLTQDRTAVPLELDQIYSSLDDLSVALGPNGANKKGALTDLLDTTARNFGGQGAKFHRTIEDFSRLSGTLADNKDQLFGSVRELEGFVHTLARNDHTVRSFNSSLAQVSQMLKGERGDLAASLHNLGDRDAPGLRLREATTGRSSVKNITGLDRITQILVKQRAALAETLRDRAAGAQQPGPHLQPRRPAPSTPAPTSASSGTRSSPTRRRSSAGSSTRRTRADRPAVPSERLLGKSRPGALTGRHRPHVVRPDGPEPRPDSWRLADDPPA